jgi:hypothetical protein
MQIRLKTINGDEVLMTVERTTLVQQFRQEVGRQLKVESDRVRLIFAGQVLGNVDRIDKFDIHDGSVIHAVVRPVIVPATTTATVLDIPVVRAAAATPSTRPAALARSQAAPAVRSTTAPMSVSGSGPFGFSMQGGDSPDASQGAGLDQFLSDIFGRSLGISSNPNPSPNRDPNPFPNSNPANNRTINLTLGPNATAAISTSRITVLRASDQFGNSIERGLSSVRAIAESVASTPSAIAPTILPADMDARAEDPSVATSQVGVRVRSDAKLLKVKT